MLRYDKRKNKKGDEKRMPFINLKLVGKLTKKQKERIALEFSQTLLEVAGKKKESTYLVIDEVEGSNWAQGDKFFG
jgi:4-oxalocrotonate tautomerase